MNNEPKISDNVDYKIERKQKVQWNIFSFLREKLYILLIIAMLISIIAIYLITSKNGKLDYYDKKIIQIESNLKKTENDLINIRDEIKKLKEEMVMYPIG